MRTDSACIPVLERIDPPLRNSHTHIFIQEYSTMLKVILADDEKKVIYLLQKLIDWEQTGYEIAGIAHDGLSALQMVEEKQPHLLITDIRMPGCSGIDLIRRARELQPALHCIIISGYREFEYAQKAIKYGVEDYLLKPLKKDELYSILLRIRDKLGEEEKIEFRRQKNAVNRQEQLLKDLRNAAARNITFVSAGEILDNYGVNLLPEAEENRICYAMVVHPDIPPAESGQGNRRILMQHSLDIVRKNIEKISSASAAGLIPEGVAAVISTPSFDAVDVRQCSTKIRKEIEQQRDLFWGIRVNISIGSRKPDTTELSSSLREAVWLCADRVCGGASVRDAESEEIPFEAHYHMQPAVRKKFRESAEYLDRAYFEATLANSFTELQQLRPLYGSMAAEWFREVVRNCTFGLSQQKNSPPSLEEDLIRRFWYCRSLQEIHDLLLQEITGNSGRMQEEKAEQESRPITLAKKYIQEHFEKPLRLEDISDMVGFNATYFSSLFKKETGQGFADYLAHVRVERAKSLLMNDDCSVMDVCEMVGYKDLKYFSRLFKKITGISPSDYRKLYR